MARVRSIVYWLLLLLFAWLLGQLIANQWSEITTPQLAPVTKHQTASSAAGSPSFLFGDFKAAMQQSSESVVNLEKLKETKLNLKLVGVIDYPNRGVALIQKGAKSKVYGLNEEIQSGVTLFEVLGDQVIILNRGVQEKLALEGVGSNHLLQSQEGSNNAKGQQVEGTQSRLSDIGKKLKRSPMSISQYLRFEPINQGGKWTGVKVWSKSDSALFRSLGFEEGDKVTLINGKTIDHMAKNPALWREFLNESKIDLTVERNGASETIAVQFGS